MTVKFEYFTDSTLAGLGYHECCVLLEDAVVTLLISLAKIALRYRLPDSEMVEFPGISLHSHNLISEALLIGTLTEYYRKWLIPTGISLDILVAFILLYEIVEVITIKKFQLFQRTSMIF